MANLRWLAAVWNCVSNTICTICINGRRTNSWPTATRPPPPLLIELQLSKFQVRFGSAETQRGTDHELPVRFIMRVRAFFHASPHRYWCIWWKISDMLKTDTGFVVLFPLISEIDRFICKPPAVGYPQN